MKKTILLYILLCFLYACNEQDVVDYKEENKKEDVIPGKVSLTLNLPAPSTVTLKAGVDKDADERVINDLYLLTYTSGGDLSEVIAVTPSTALKPTGDNNKRKLEITLTKPMSSLHVVANAGSTLATALQSEKDLYKLFYGSGTQSPFVMWGKCDDIHKLIDNSAEIPLYNNVAKTTVEASSSLTNFEIQSVKLLYTSTKGSIAPLGYEAGVLTEEATPTYTMEQTATTVSAPIYFYETSNKAHTRLLLQAKYDGVVGYYSVAYLSPEGKEIDLIRNHYYKVIINSVDKGYSTPAEALKNPAANIRVQILDYSPKITDFVANGSYALGIGGPLVFGANETTLHTYIVSSYSDDINTLCTATIKSGADWIESVTLVDHVEGNYEFGTMETNAIVAQYEVKVKRNTISENERSGTILFRSGNLEMVLAVSQNGADLKKADSRKVLLYEDGILLKNDYWKFISDEMHGVNPIDMNETVRNQGLHFSVIDNKYSYKIKHNPGDLYVKGTNADKFSITNSPDDTEWTVTLAGDNSQTNTTWEGAFTVTTTDNLTINYSVYRTGIFSEEKGEFQVPSTPITGWYYYEMVKIGTSYWLDRNLGASSNQFFSYASDYVAGNNENSIGAYYRITNALKEKLNPCPKGFKVPVDTEFEGMKIVPKLTTVQGSSYTYYRPEAPISESSLNQSVVYFPLIKYMDNDALKGNLGGYYWTSTKVSGFQGFDENSKEFGYWYRFLSIMGGEYTFSNVRIANGSNGEIRDVFKGMPIRCIRG